MQANLTPAPLLEVENVSKNFLGVRALQEVSFTIPRGSLISLIGPNGSGKATMFNCISGFLKLDGGRVRFKGEDISNMRPDKVALRGLRRTFQDVRTFNEMTVLENLMTALQQHQEENLVARLIGTRQIQQYEEEGLDRAHKLLEMVDFVTALMPDPDLIMLDEPAAGVSGEMVDRMKRYIMMQHEQGKTVLVVEHNMRVVMDISEHIIVLDYGRKIAEGTPREAHENPLVREA